MLNKIPAVSEFMTHAPVTISRETPLEKAQAMMSEYRIRHLPVTEGNVLVGILSERNLRGALLAKAGSLNASDAMIPDPYVASMDAPLDEVAALMAEDKYGSAIITDDDGKVVGVFTTVDACRALRQVLASSLG